MITEHTQGLPYTFTPLPWEAIAATGMSLQKQGEETQSSMDAIGALKDQQKVLKDVLAYGKDRTSAELNPYSADRDYVESLFNDVNSQVAAVTEKYKGNMLDPKLKYEIRNIQNRLNKELSSGRLAQVNANYASEMERRKQWEKEGKIWSQEGSKAHDFLMRGNQFLETGQGLQNAPIGTYTDRTKLIRESVTALDPTIVKDISGTNGKYIVKNIINSVGEYGDPRLRNNLISLVEGNSELKESVDLEIQQKLYQMGMQDPNQQVTIDVPVYGKDGSVIDKKKRTDSAYNIMKDDVVSNLYSYGLSYAHSDKDWSMSGDPYGRLDYGKKLTDPPMQLPRNYDIESFRNTKNVEDVTNKFGDLNTYLKNESIPLSAEQKKKLQSYYWTLDIYDKATHGEKITKEQETALLDLAKKYGISASGMNMHGLASVIASKQMDEAKQLEKTTGYKVPLSTDKKEVDGLIAGYKKTYSSLWDDYKKKLGDNTKATQAFLQEIQQIETGRVQGHTTSAFAADQEIGKAEVDNLIFDLDSGATYEIDNETLSYDTNKPLALSASDKWNKVSLVKWEPTSRSAMIKLTNEDGKQAAVNVSALNQDTQKLVTVVGKANDVFLRKDEKSFQDQSIGDGLVVKKFKDGTVYVGYKNSDGKYDNGTLYNNIQEFNYDYDNKFAISINPQKKGYKKGLTFSELMALDTDEVANETK